MKEFLAKTWVKTRAVLIWIGSNVFGPVLAVLLICLAVLLVAFGANTLQIGGLLGKLLGKKPVEKKSVDVANTIPENRIRPDGSLIKEGEPDSHGMQQIEIVPIQEPTLFSDPTTVIFQPKGEEKPIEIQLPDGVKNTDVDKVIVVAPEVYAVTVHDNSNITADHVDDLLKKYSKK